MVYAPIVLALLCVFTIFNVYARILQFVGIDSDDVIDSDESHILLREGTMLLDQAKRRYRHTRGTSTTSSQSQGGGGSDTARDVRRGQSREVIISPIHNKEVEMSQV